MANKFKKTIPNKEYKISFGVIQSEKIGKAANTVNETPKDFIKKSTIDRAESEIIAGNLDGKK